MTGLDWVNSLGVCVWRGAQHATLRTGKGDKMIGKSGARVDGLDRSCGDDDHDGCLSFGFPGIGNESWRTSWE